MTLQGEKGQEPFNFRRWNLFTHYVIGERDLTWVNLDKRRTSLDVDSRDESPHYSPTVLCDLHRGIVLLGDS